MPPDVARELTKIFGVTQQIVPVVKIEQQLTLKDFETAFRSVLIPLLESQQGIIEQNQKLQEQVAELCEKIENMKAGT